MNATDVSIIIVSFNTCHVLKECLQTLMKETHSIRHEVIVIDNASKDGSAEMVTQEFPHVQLICSPTNLGFAAANNVGFAQAHGKYVVLLNSDAFLTDHALTKAVAFMETHPNVGMTGARLISRDGSWQPSARMFPGLLNHFLTLSGLAARYPKSKFLGRVDRTWADPLQPASVDWIPGAFAIIRRTVLETVGYFDEDFFLYYEEVDLCKRIKAAGYEVWYLPEIVVIHLGGESSKTLKDMMISTKGNQVSLWQLRSALLFYRKHHGALWTWLWMQLENTWHLLRMWKNRWSSYPNRGYKVTFSQTARQLLRQAWQDTQGGRISPPRPW